VEVTRTGRDVGGSAGVEEPVGGLWQRLVRADAGGVERGKERALVPGVGARVLILCRHRAVGLDRRARSTDYIR
jgi:hypothetical protein